MYLCKHVFYLCMNEYMYCIYVSVHTCIYKIHAHKQTHLYIYIFDIINFKNIRGLQVKNS